MSRDNPQICIKQNLHHIWRHKCHRRGSCKRVRLLKGMGHQLQRDICFLLVIYMYTLVWYKVHFHICVWVYMQSHWKSTFYEEHFRGIKRPCKDEFSINLNLLQLCYQQSACAERQRSLLSTRTRTETTYWRESLSNGEGFSWPFPGQCKYLWPKSNLDLTLSKALYQRKHCSLYLLASETYQTVYHHNLNSRLRGHSLDCSWNVKGFHSKEIGVWRKKDIWSVWHQHSCVICASRIPNVENLPWQETAASSK